MRNNQLWGKEDFMRRPLVLLLLVLALMAMAPTASFQPPTNCGTLTGRDYAQTHIVPSTPGHVPGEHRGCAGFPF
jgi:hypothetical protein